MEVPEPKPKPFFQNGRIQFTFMKTPFAWFTKTPLQSPEEDSKLKVRVSRTVDGKSGEVQKFGKVEGGKWAEGSSWIWHLGPGGFRPRALILAERMGDTKDDIDRFELESRRWAAAFCQTVHFEPGKTRKATYRRDSDAKDPAITITTSPNIPWLADGDPKQQFETLRPFSDKSAPTRPAIISEMANVIEKDDENVTGVTSAWERDVNSLVWADNKPEKRAKGQSIAYDPQEGPDDDEPGPIFYFNLEPFAVGGEQIEEFKQYKLKAASGQEEFKTWLILYRYRLKEGEDTDLDRKLNDNIDKPASERTDYRELPCVVPVAFLYWKSSYGVDFGYSASSTYPIARPREHEYYVSPAEPLEKNKNWREFDLIKEPRLFYELPDMSGPDGWKLFPEIRYTANASEYLYCYVQRDTLQGEPEMIDYYKEDQSDDEWEIQQRPGEGEPWDFNNGRKKIEDESILSREKKEDGKQT